MEVCSLSSKVAKRIKCPVCLNSMVLVSHNDGCSGQCPVCKSVIFSKQHSAKVTFVKIIKK